MLTSGPTVNRSGQPQRTAGTGAQRAGNRVPNQPQAAVRAASHPIEVKVANLDLVLEAALVRNGPFTRADLRADTDLSAPTICSLAIHLTRLGLLREVGSRVSGGRRAGLMEFNAQYGLVMGVHIGPGRTSLGLCNFRQQLLGHHVVPTHGGNGSSNSIEQLIRQASELIAQGRTTHGPVLAIAIAVPGVVNDEAGEFVSSSSVQEWRDVPVRQLMETAFGAPVVVRNAVDLALVGEHMRGAARGHETCAFISAGPEIATAVMIRGELHLGQHFMAGKIGPPCLWGHSPNQRGKHSGCAVHLAATGAEAPALCSRPPAQPFGDDPAALDTENIACALGVAAASTAAVIDPSIIVLGGTWLERSPALIDRVNSVVRGLSQEPIAVVSSALGSEASLWGALLIGLRAARERLRSDIREQVA